MSQRKCYVFTLNNYEDDEFDRIRDRLGEVCEFAIIGKEVGDANGIRHLQGYACFKQRRRFTSVKEILGTRCHIEGAKGNPQQNYDYCSKQGDFVVIGSFPKRKSSPLDLVCEDIRAGASLSDIADKHMATFIRYPRGIQRTLEILGESTQRSWKTGLLSRGGPAPPNPPSTFL